MNYSLQYLILILIIFLNQSRVAFYNYGQGSGHRYLAAELNKRRFSLA